MELLQNLRQVKAIVHVAWAECARQLKIIIHKNLVRVGTVIIKYYAKLTVERRGIKLIFRDENHLQLRTSAFSSKQF